MSLARIKSRGIGIVASTPDRQKAAKNLLAADTYRVSPPEERTL